jgi:hypothetical protein
MSGTIVAVARREGKGKGKEREGGAKLLSPMTVLSGIGIGTYHQQYFTK